MPELFRPIQNPPFGVFQGASCVFPGEVVFLLVHTTDHGSAVSNHID